MDTSGSRPIRSSGASPRRLAWLFLLGGLVSADLALAVDPPKWLGPDGEPLPFQSDQEVVEFLARAQVVREKEISAGINTPYKLTLEHGGITANAIFRSVSRTKTEGRGRDFDRANPLFRDSYHYEVAAYTVSRMLGLDNVPPAILYEYKGRRGSLQLWIEEAESENERIARGGELASPASWYLQKQTMKIFDNLIYNFDRNNGNLLVDVRGKVWFIDHTRSFKRLPSLVTPEEIQVCDAELWERLQQLDKSAFRQALQEYLSGIELDALTKRHRKLVELIANLIEEKGPETVLIARDDQVSG